MTAIKSSLCGIIWLAALGYAQAQQAELKTGTDQVRIGVYDSRAIAVASAGSEYYTHHIKPLEDEFRKAKEEGNQDLVRELEPKVWARRKQSHRQAFSTAPVDEILEYIKDEIPAIAGKAGVGPIVSKWDTDALAQYAAAEKVDVTMPLVEAFKPREKSLKWAEEVQKTPPVPLQELEEHMAGELRQGNADARAKKAMSPEAQKAAPPVMEAPAN